MPSILTCPRARSAGFTLIELVIVLSVVGILAALATPALQNLLMDIRMTTRVNEFVSHLHLARSEAIHRGQRIALCPSSDQMTCAKAPQWQNGWIIFVNSIVSRHGSEIHESSEEILRIQNQRHPSFTIKTVSRNPIEFRPQGTAGGSTATITFCDTRGASKARAVVLSNAGRVRVTTTQPGTRKPLSCA